MRNAIASFTYSFVRSFSHRPLSSGCVCQRSLFQGQISSPAAPTLPLLPDPLSWDPSTLEMSTMEFTFSRSFLCFSRTWRNLGVKKMGGQSGPSSEVG